MELPLCAVLARMETAGVLVDQMALVAFGNMLSERIAACQDIIYGYAGGEFNINSPKQLGELLFEKLGLPAMKKTKSGYSTNAEVLEKLKNKHPIVAGHSGLPDAGQAEIDVCRRACEGDRGRRAHPHDVPEHGDGDGAAHRPRSRICRISLCGRSLAARSAGCSSRRTAACFVDADYSQIELRVLAHIADDAHDAGGVLRAGWTSTRRRRRRSSAWRRSRSRRCMRRHAKAVNFGIVYGISEFSLAEDIGVTRKEAKAYIENVPRELLRRAARICTTSWRRRRRTAM